jgi:hypothetical protein
LCACQTFLPAKPAEVVVAIILHVRFERCLDSQLVFLSSACARSSGGIVDCSSIRPVAWKASRFPGYVRPPQQPRRHRNACLAVAQLGRWHQSELNWDEKSAFERRPVGLEGSGKSLRSRTPGRFERSVKPRLSAIACI